MAEDTLADLLSEQVAYYRARAGEYDATYPLDDGADIEARARLVASLEALAPYGRVLELACGTGQWTAELARHASALTAVDSSPEALAICRRPLDAPHVRLVEADLFSWCPRESYDLVFFAAWLSHVPPQRFDAMWAFVDDCLAPGGQAFVIDELPAVAALELEDPACGRPAPTVRRRLTTALGWHAQVRTVGWRFFCATIARARSQAARMTSEAARTTGGLTRASVRRAP